MLRALLILVLALLAGCGGSGEPTQAANATASLPATPTSGGWQEYTSSEGRFIILMPGEPEVETLTAETATGQEVQGTVAKVEVGGVTYMANYTDLPPGSLAMSEDEFFDEYIALVLQNVENESGVKIDPPEVETISIDGYPGREVTYGAKGEQISRFRTYLVEGRQYQIIVAGPEVEVASEDTTRYLESFKLLK